MRRHGVTLVELLLLLAALALLLGIATPSLRHQADRIAVRIARSEVLHALDVTRGAAIRRGSPVELTLLPPRWVVRDASGTDSLPIWSGPGPTRHGVALQGLGAPITFGAAGLASGTSNRTLHLQRGTATATVVLSRLGRIR